LEDKKQPASQSQLFCRVTCESESAILQGHLHGQGFRLRSIQLKVECLAACGGEGMLLRKCSHVWQRSSPKECSSCPCESESDVLEDKKQPTSQSQMFCRATCELESDILQGNLRVRVRYFAGQPPRAGIPLEVNPAEGCMLGRLWRGGHAPAKMPPCLAKVLPQGVLTMSLRVRVRCFPS
jgi:hypothetical protein